MQNKLTIEQIEDIKNRETKGLELLKELDLTPAASIAKIHIGDDMFIDKITPFLQDTKYVEKPITPKAEVK